MPIILMAAVLGKVNLPNSIPKYMRREYVVQYNTIQYNTIQYNTEHIHIQPFPFVPVKKARVYMYKAVSHPCSEPLQPMGVVDFVDSGDGEISVNAEN